MSGEATAQRYDCIVIGAGHNGLVAATLLARAGRRVLVLEAAGQVGGAAVTRMFHPGFRVSAGAHLLHLMPSRLQRDLGLEAHGLRFASTQLPTTALGAEGTWLSVGQDLGTSDAAAFAAYTARMRRFGAALAPIMGSVAPRLGTDRWSDRFALLGMGWQIRKLGRTDMRELLRIGGMNVYDLVKEHVESPLLQGALGLDAILGTNFGPRSPGTVLTLLYRLAAESGATGGIAQPLGGMGAVCDALAKAAVAAGVTLRLDAPVAEVLVAADRASGVRLVSGEQFAAGTVISNADPKTTFLRLLGARHLDTGFVRRVTHLRSKGLTAKLHLALSAAPRFSGVDAARLRGRLVIAPSLEHIERAYNHSKYGEFSSAPVMEITVPSQADPGLAPAGQHVLSAVVQYAPYELKGGWDPAQRLAFTGLLVDTLERYAPGIRDSILGAELLAPPDLEREFRMTGGHWHHADLAFDQFLMVRPVPGAAQHATPLAGLYLCGAGCHPGGGVMGVAGRNAALQVLKAGDRT
jgi:phytoene dehydrogenase-like protein